MHERSIRGIRTKCSATCHVGLAFLTNPILSASDVSESDGLVGNAGTRTDLYLRKFTDMFNIFYILRLIIGRIGRRNDRMGLQ